MNEMTPAEDITDDEIDALCELAVRTDNNPLLFDTYEARGFGRRVGVLPLVGEVRRARARCATARDAVRAGADPADRSGS